MATELKWNDILVIKVYPELLEYYYHSSVIRTTLHEKRMFFLFLELKCILQQQSESDCVVVPIEDSLASRFARWSLFCVEWGSSTVLQLFFDCRIKLVTLFINKE